ncbi:hypothetical protein ACJJTC_019304 [Scirpophaga incertulas]
MTVGRSDVSDVGNDNTIPLPTHNSEEDKPKQEAKSPVERKIEKDLKRNIPKENIPGLPNQREGEGAGGEDVAVRRERLFKRKGEEGGRCRLMKRRQTPSSPLLGDKERSSSMSKLLGRVSGYFKR